jgi:hypothetical protein
MIATFVLLAAVTNAAAEEERMLVTVDKPATVPIVQSLATDALKEGPRHVVVTVTGFQPSLGGPVQAIVEAHCGASLVEIGRFGLLPQTPFTAAEPRKAQRFSFNIAGSTCDGLDSVTIRLVPSHGDGHGASLEIGSAELR